MPSPNSFGGDNLRSPPLRRGAYGDDALSRRLQQLGPPGNASANRQRRQNGIPISVARVQALAGGQRKGERPMTDRLYIGDCANVHEKRALNANKSGGREHGVEPLNRLAGDISELREVILDVVSRGFDKVDLTGIQRIKPMIAFANQKHGSSGFHFLV